MKLSAIRNNRWMQGDMSIWMVLITLIVISLIEVYSASSNMSYSDGRYWSPILEHAGYMLAGLAVAWGISLSNCKFFKVFCALFILVSILLLLYALFFGKQINGAGRWIFIAGRTIQPSEIAKISMIGFTSFLLTLRDKNTGEAHSASVKMALGVLIVLCGLIASENFSTAGLLYVVILALLWIGKSPKKLLLIAFLVPAIGGGILLFTAKTMSIDTANAIADKVSVLHRLPTWVNRLQKDHSLPENPKNYKVNENQQVGHAQIAIATCNVIGKGPGNSVERDYLPQAFSDFIYAIIIEEGGIESALLVLFLYLFLLYRAWKIADRCATRFPAYLVMGLSMMLVAQALINMGVAVGLLPVTGQPLPLISKGGTSTIITCAYIGMMLSVSRSARKIQDEELALPEPVSNN